MKNGGRYRIDGESGGILVIKRVGNKMVLSIRDSDESFVESREVKIGTPQQYRHLLSMINSCMWAKEDE